MAELFAKNAFEQVHRLSDEMKLEEGSAGKVVLHAVVAGITAKLGGDSFSAGSMAGAINEIMNGEISRYEKAHNKGLTPAEHQWISAAVGAIDNSATGSTIQADAVYATKWRKNMEIKYIFTNIILISILYYAFKLFDRKYSYCKTYTFGYIIGFVAAYIIPMAIFDIGYFVDVSWKLILFSFNLIGIGFVISWHGFMAYNKEKINKEGVCPNPTLVANPKMFKTIVYSYFIMTIITTLLVLFL